MTKNSAIATVQQKARRVAAYLERIGRKISHPQALEAMAAAEGHRNWNVYAAVLNTPAQEPSLVLGRADAETGTVLVLGSSDKHLTTAQLTAITNDLEFQLDVVVPVNLWEIANKGDIDWLNDEVSERITGSTCGLESIVYARFHPENADALAPDMDMVFLRVTARWARDDWDDEGNN